MNLSLPPDLTVRLAGGLRQALRWVQGYWWSMINGSTVRVGVGNSPGPQRICQRDQRRHPRISLQGLSVHVTDGCLFATAVMENISPGGLCLSNLPEQLYNHCAPLTVYSSNNPGLPVLHIQPRWQKSDWTGKTIGAAVLNATDAWRLFFVHTASRLSA